MRASQSVKAKKPVAATAAYLGEDVRFVLSVCRPARYPASSALRPQVGLWLGWCGCCVQIPTPKLSGAALRSLDSLVRRHLATFQFQLLCHYHTERFPRAETDFGVQVALARVRQPRRRPVCRAPAGKSTFVIDFPVMRLCTAPFDCEVSWIPSACSRSGLQKGEQFDVAWNNCAVALVKAAENHCFLVRARCVCVLLAFGCFTRCSFVELRRALGPACCSWSLCGCCR